MKSFRKGNNIFAVHINSIAGKDKQTKLQGPNPLGFLGVSFSPDGNTGTLHELVGGIWQPYTEIDGSATYQTGGVAQEYRGQGFNLGQWYRTYDWIANDGYNNFATWAA